MPNKRSAVRTLDDNTEVEISHEQLAAKGYGLPTILTQPSEKQIAIPLDIFKIYPDPTQPRRIVPSAARENWNGKPETVTDMLHAWLELVSEELGVFELDHYLEPSGDFERPAETSPLRAELLEVIDLAVSIRDQGLTNAITVIRFKDEYRLETGERRWLAYHLLYAYYHDEKWLKIPARIVDEIDVWRQATENSARSDLNAIGRARQLAILIMDLHRQQGTIFHSFEELVSPGGCDRVYYAQVADGNEYRIPRGQSERLLSTMSLKDPSRLRQYRELLRLPDELWMKADDLNWSDVYIRGLVQEDGSGDTENKFTVSKENTADQTSPSTPKRASGSSLPSYVQSLKRLRPLSIQTALPNEEIRQQALRDIAEVEKWLADLKRKLSRESASE